METTILNTHYGVEVKTPVKTNLEQLTRNLTRYWQALRRELGNNELLREDFKQTIRYELIKGGLIDEVDEENLAEEIFNN